MHYLRGENRMDSASNDVNGELSSVSASSSELDVREEEDGRRYSQ